MDETIHHKSDVWCIKIDESYAINVKDFNIKMDSSKENVMIEQYYKM